MHTSVLSPIPILGLGSGLLPVSRRPIPVMPSGPAVSGVQVWPVVGSSEADDWRAELARAIGRVPGVGGACGSTNWRQGSMSGSIMTAIFHPGPEGRIGLWGIRGSGR
jgi:hypothetical protein